MGERRDATGVVGRRGGALSAASPRAHPDPWTHARLVGRQLALWSLLSVGVGLLGITLHAAGAWPAAWTRTVFAFALQCLVWGAIDGLIAAVGARDLRRRLAAGEHADPAATAAFGARLLRLLRLNAALDVLYVLVGVLLLTLWRTPDGLGHGLGVLVQGGFLLLFDAWHALAWVPRRRALAR